MHPILFRIPLPKMTIYWAWVLLAGAVVALAYAGWQHFAKRDKSNALGGVIVGVLAGAGAVFLHLNKEGGAGKSFELGPVPIYSYGVMLGLSLVVGWYLTLGLAEKEGLPKETMANNYVVTAVAAVAGSRILYVLTNLHEFESFWDVFAMRRGGLVAYGGFLGGFAGSYFFLKRHNLPLLPWADVAVPSLASGLMITRIGCYLFGCDFGKPLTASAPVWLKKLGTFPQWPEGTLDSGGSGSPAWAQHYNAQLLDPGATHSLPVHPTQLYESLVGAGLLAFLLTMRRFQKFRGQIFLLFTFAYGVCRFGLEIFRDDKERGSIPPALPEHVILTFGLALLSVGYVIGFSKMIRNIAVRRITQVIAFVPPVLVFLLKRPETFASPELYQLSTSQFVAMSTGFGAAIAFTVFYRAALAHPESAMNLGLPLVAGPAVPSAAEADDEDDEEEARPQARKASDTSGVRARTAGSPTEPVRKKKKKKKPVVAVESEASESDAADEAKGEEPKDAADEAVDDEAKGDDGEDAKDESKDESKDDASERTSEPPDSTKEK